MSSDTDTLGGMVWVLQEEVNPEPHNPEPIGTPEQTEEQRIWWAGIEAARAAYHPWRRFAILIVVFVAWFFVGQLILQTSNILPLRILDILILLALGVAAIYSMPNDNQLHNPGVAAQCSPERRPLTGREPRR